MRYSDRMKIYITRCVKITIFLLIFTAINTMICHYLGPSAHKSNEMWNYYYSQENADTIIVGTSVTEMINEYVIDEYTGRCTVNMGTPSQYFATSRDIIKTAAKERPVDTVILMMGFDALERDEDLTAALSVEKAFYDSKSTLQKLKGFLKDNLVYSLDMRNIAESDSVNKWMSWPVNCTVYFDQIKSNWEKKLYYKDVVDDPAVKLLAQNGTKYNRTEVSKVHSVSADIEEKINNIQSIEISYDSLYILREMGDYCNANGISFFVMISPHKQGYSSSFDGDYEKLDDLVKTYVESMGCLYLNLNELPDVQNAMTDEYFTDSEHVTHEGIEKASGIMSDILNLLTGRRN